MASDCFTFIIFFQVSIISYLLTERGDQLRGDATRVFRPGIGGDDIFAVMVMGFGGGK
jgi:hypothetical protein